MISSTIQLPNRVTLKGSNGRGVTIRAAPGFQGTCMIHASNGKLSMFASRVEDMMLDAGNLRPVTGVIPAVIRSDAWQETCGLTRVVLIGFVGYGLELQHGWGGAAYLPLRDIEIFGAAGSIAGIMVHQISKVGAFQLSIDGATIAMTASAAKSTAIVMANDTLHCRGLHVERCATAIAAGGCGCLSLDTITLSPSDTVDLLHLLPTFTGCVSARILMPNVAKGSTIICEAPGPQKGSVKGNVAGWVYQPPKTE